MTRDENIKTLVAANSIIDSVRQDAEPTPADNLKALIQDCGVPPHKITELVQELPPQRFSSVLIDFYFTAVYVLVCHKGAFLNSRTLLVTGLVTRYPSETSASLTPLSVPMALAHILVTFASYLCSLLSLQLPSVWHRST